MKKLSLLVLMFMVVGVVYGAEVYNQPFTSDLGDAIIYDAQGAEAWGWVSYDNGCAKMSGYASGAQDNVDWLITPSLNLTSYTNVALDFREAINYGGTVADEQEIYASTDYIGSGDPAAASWTKLAVTGRSSGSSWSFVDVDQFSLAAYDGESSLYIGFKYTSTTSGAATWEIGEIVVTGTTSSPELSVTTTTLSGFSYEVGNGPSAEQTFGVSGANLTGDVTISAPANYEVSATSGLNFANALTFNAGSGTLAETTVYARLKAGLPEGVYNGEDITITSTGAISKTVTCSGSVTPDLASVPALMISEVADPGDNYNARFVELYNASGADIDFAVQTWYFDRQANGGSHSSIQLTGTLLAGETYVIGNEGNINSAYGPGTANLDFGSVTGNGDDGYFLYYNGDENSGVLYDAYGVVDEDGSGKPWEYTDSRAVRTNAVTGNPTWTAAEWTITSADVIDCTPGIVDANQALPVTLTSFTATPVNSEFVSISWTTESESGMQCYNLYRNEGNGLEWITSQNAVNVTTTTIYSFEDTEVEVGATYEYVLEGVEVDGTSAILGTVSATIEEQATPQLPQATLLSGNFPNPFNPATTISFVVKEAETATLTIYDMKGRTISAEKFETGVHAITWDATEYGSGVYFYKLASPSCHEVKKMIMLK